jgi:hypothetical protein
VHEEDEASDDAGSIIVHTPTPSEAENLILPAVALR